MRRNAHRAVLNFNCPVRMTTVPRDTIRRFADLLNVDDEHVRMWMFARLPYPDQSRLLGGEEQVEASSHFLDVPRIVDPRSYPQFVV